MTLFRKEAIERQATRLEGDVFVGVPITWRIVGFSLGASVVVALAFLAMATFPRFEVARGVVRPDLGIATILPPAPGTVTDVHVENGARVGSGQALVSAEAQDFLASGEGAATQIIEALRRQAASVEAQVAAAGEEAAAEARRLAAQVRGLDEEVRIIDDQIALQQERVAAAEDDLEAIRSAVERGTIARRELSAREEVLAGRSQQLNQLRQTRAGRMSALEEAQRSREQLAARTSEREARFAAQLQELAQTIAANERLRAYVLRAPVAGTVSNLSARVGTSLVPERAVAAIIPEGSRLEVELQVPSRVIGFVAEGQLVRMAIDTFPYERFGTVAGTIVEVARTADAARDGELTYPVRVSLAKDHVEAFGERQPFVSGMTLTARIVTREQSLIEWLFEPFYAVSRR
jgi:membrane fusion protein